MMNKRMWLVIIGLIGFFLVSQSYAGVYCLSPNGSNDGAGRDLKAYNDDDTVRSIPITGGPINLGANKARCFSAITNSIDLIDVQSNLTARNLAAGHYFISYLKDFDLFRARRTGDMMYQFSNDNTLRVSGCPKSVSLIEFLNVDDREPQSEYAVEVFKLNPVTNSAYYSNGSIAFNYDGLTFSTNLIRISRLGFNINQNDPQHANSADQTTADAHKGVNAVYTDVQMDVVDPSNLNSRAPVTVKGLRPGNYKITVIACAVGQKKATITFENQSP